MNMYNEWPARHKNDKNPSPKIIALGKKITDVAAHKLKGVTVGDPEYWGLAEIITEEMAEVGLSMKLRTPYTFSEMCKLNHIDKAGEAKFQKLLDEMSYIGLLEYDYGYHYDHNGRTKEQTERRYILPMFVPGSAELFNMEELPDGSNPRLRDHPDVASFFERMTYIPLAGITQMVPPGGAGIGMHVIPVEKAISMENQSVDLEHLSYWLSKYEGKIGVGRCSCRASRKVLGDGCGDDDYGWCIGVGDFADYCRETGKGHDITKEEALAILKRAEDNGFVHQITNIDGENKIFGICNCNVNICNALRTSQLFNTPNMSRSAYVAHVEKEKCVACGRCVEYCPAGALKLGQKLCTKDGGEIEYPRQELPDAVKWGPDKWDPDYRDHNRINCHETGTAPCKTACPAHIAVQGYLKKAAQGEYREALALIKKQNPFPAVCGRICNRRCEDACTRGSIDQAIAIDAVKKFIADQDLKAETRYIPPVVIPASIHKDRWDEKIAIIGGGPAGLTAAYYLAERGYYPTIFEKNEMPGGMLRYGIPSYKLEKDVIEAEIDVMREMGVEIKTGVEVGKDVTLDELRAQGYKAFYIAIGCSAGRRPGIPNDTAEGTMTAIDYLKEANTGNTTYAGKVVVVGGGNVAIDASRVSIRSGAAEVTQLCLESEKEMPASDEEVREASEDGVIIKNGWGPKEVLVTDGKVSGIVFKRCISVFDAEKRFHPVYDEDDTITIACDRIIFAIGQQIVWGDLLKGTKVEFGRGNGPVADSLTFQTAEPDIFVGGDVYTGPKFAIDAIAQGHYAAESLHRFVQGGHMTIGRNKWEFIELDKENISVPSYDNSSRQIEGVDASVPDKSFRDAHLTLTEEQVKIETARCLGCGASIVDPNKCIGCGVCTTKCAFDAITLHRDRPECTKMVKAEDKFKHIIPYQLKRAVKIATHKKEK
ncbi:FAD-dependent oxidoreductase [Bariatricus sp. SGI.154]|uniref:FAD-dependent oxidoreductase n=1 Tax=Bariatricus sp. SGI.154 TaxID=3420549 RepID=UPI003D07070D